MFGSNFVNINKNIVQFVRCMSFSQNAPSLERSRPVGENLFVRLCGEIIKSPTITSNGALYFPMTTTNGQEDFHAEHHIFVPPSVLRKQSADQFAAGIRVYTIGRIGYKELKSADGYSMQEAQINSHTIFLCATNDKSSKDVNEIKLYGFVKNKPHIDDNATDLVVATKYFDLKEQRYKSNLHDVVIKKDDEIRQRANRMDAGAGVFIHGYLNSEHIRNQNGSMRISSYIRPTKLIVCQPTKINFGLGDYWT